ncbi:MAG: flagellar basal body-associated FliL family protein [Pseudomonadota bacterium]|nr:flagellar basal body-associated FliL family protein [Pseudomonadota bacterium]
MAQAQAADGKDNAPAESSNRMMLIVIIIGVVLILLVGGGIAAFVLMADDPQPVVAEEQEPVEAPAIYYPMEPPFVVNFGSPDSPRFLQVGISIAVTKDETIEVIHSHNPMIRNNLLLILSNQDFGELGTLEGKESLRAEMLEELGRVLEEKTGERDVTQVYLTSFVMQ